MSFPHHTIDSAPDDSRATTLSTDQQFGAVPEAVALLASSPQLLEFTIPGITVALNVPLNNGLTRLDPNDPRQLTSEPTSTPDDRLQTPAGSWRACLRWPC